MQRWILIFSFALLGAVGWVEFGPVEGAYGEDNEESHETALIRLDRCRIQFIDEAVLATDRVGVLDFVEPEEGDQVRAGQEVAKLRSEVAQANYNIAKERAANDIDLRFSRKSRDLAYVEYQKALDINKKIPDGDAISDLEVRRLKLAAEKGDLQVENAEHEFKLNKLARKKALAELETYSIKAPFDGIARRVHKSRGEAVRQGDPILEIVNSDRLQVEGEVSVKEALKIKAGTYVTVQLEVPGEDLSAEKEVFEGRIVFVDLAVQAVKGKVRVKAEVNNKENILRPGLWAKMTIYPNQNVTPESLLNADSGAK